MQPLTLLFHENPATGLPYLEEPGGTLTEQELKILEQQLHDRYQELASSRPGQHITLDRSNPPQLPRVFSIVVQWKDRQRCPTFLLTAVKEEEYRPHDEKTQVTRKTKAPVERWQTDMLIDLAEFLSEPSETNGNHQQALNFVLADMRRVLKKNPQVLTQLLLAGFLHVGNAICREHGDIGVNKYVEAAQELAMRENANLPAGTLDSLIRLLGESAAAKRESSGVLAK